MIKTKFILALSLSLPLMVAAQKNLTNAILTDKNGQQKNVKIEVQKWTLNPETITFYDSNNSLNEIATIQNTSKLSIGAERAFETAIINKSMNKVKYPNLPKYLDSTSTKDTVFLDVIVEGKRLNLYSYTDTLKTRFYIKKQSGLYEELIFRNFYSAAIDFKVETQNIFRDQLKRIMTSIGNNNVNLVSKINDAKYAAKDLEEIVVLINDDQNSFVQPIKSKVNFLAGIGVNFSTFNYNGENVLGTSSSSNPISILPTVGMSISLDEKNKSELNFEVSALKEKVKFYGIDNRSEETQSFTQISYMFSPTYNYHVYSNNNTKITIGSGISANIHQIKDDVVTYKSTEIPGAQIVINRDLGGYQSFSYAIPFRLAVSYQKFTLLSTYSYYLSSITNTAETEILKSGLSFGLRYNFGKGI
ncbi:MAG: hypothetical protein V4546_16375 [Bacteroidota bacterium]